jgi:hypothetical protein
MRQDPLTRSVNGFVDTKSQPYIIFNQRLTIVSKLTQCVHPFSQSHTIIVFNHSKTQIAYMMHHDLFLFTSPYILSWLIPQIELLPIPGVQTKNQELSIPSHMDCNFHEIDPNLRKLVKLG